MNRKLILFSLLIIILLVVGSLFYSGTGELTVYSGRSENLIGPVFEQFSEKTGIEVDVRYGGTAELAATILEEGDNSPADIFFAQDAGGLGALADNNRLQNVPENSWRKVDPRLRSPEQQWLGTSGRARVIGYNTEQVDQENLPDSIWEFTEPEWENRIGWAPTNGSFQAFITALRVLEGEERTLQWLEDILENNPQNYENNTSIVDALGRGEIDVGFVNHYYLFRFIEEQGEEFPVNNHYTTGDAGSMINIAGIGILSHSEQTEEAEKFIDFVLSEDIQQYFIEENHEYPVTQEVSMKSEQILPLADIDTPEIDLNSLNELEKTLELLREAGAI